ncbi:MAG: hypothetical protein FWC79_06485 [Oscillospiraceae bacterium]|nr:hypothetical protein [Oscillospiraceae bacterium]
MKKQAVIMITILILAVLVPILFFVLRDEIVMIAGEEFSARHTTELDIIPTSLQDIDGIARLGNLERLRILDAENVFPTFEEGELLLDVISELDNLRDLELAFIPIDGYSLSHLSALTELERLDISNSWLEDISAIAGLVNLQELRLSNNNITDLSPVRNMMRA